MAAKKKTNAELTPEELKAKRSAAAKKAAATRAANKAKREAEAAANAETGGVIAEALVAEDADAPAVEPDNPDDVDAGPGERIDHAAFAESDEVADEDYDEPLPFETDPNAPKSGEAIDDVLDAEAMALVNAAVGGSKSKKKKDKSEKQENPLNKTEN